MTAARAESDGWPAQRVEDWVATRDTFHLWTQVIGKIRLACTPMVNHWWNVPLYVTATGLTTSRIPYHGGRGFQIDLDLLEHELSVVDSDGARRALALEPMAVADFYGAVMGLLGELDLPVEIWTMPVEIAGAIPFDKDHEHASYDAVQVTTFWRVLGQSQRVFEVFRSRYLGKSSPVHLFWGALDLAVTRFSGRVAPPHPGGAPHCGPQVMHEAYSREVSSCGFWPGPDGEGSFYSYAYPEPGGFRDAKIGPEGAGYVAELGEFILPYEQVRTAGDPDAVLLEFLQTSYEAAADLAKWDRALLERHPPTRSLP
jgi:Family of unknown function (DUF5996)